MTYEEKKQRWLQVQCKSWSDPDYSFLITELRRAWEALEMYAAMGHVVSTADYGKRAREALK